jgi:hypothetical protein
MKMPIASADLAARRAFPPRGMILVLGIDGRQAGHDRSSGMALSALARRRDMLMSPDAAHSEAIDTAPFFSHNKRSPFIRRGGAPCPYRSSPEPSAF